jgi:AAA+ ATPase superfamily predicted ATPase
MKFYNREDELAILNRADTMKSKRSVMSMVIGRRRVGKTALILHPWDEKEVLYFFVSKKSEKLLCEEYVEEISQKLDEKIYGTISTIEALFEYLLDLGKRKPFTLIFDEFQEFYHVNPAIYTSIQKLWDLNKEESHVHFIACGSVYSLMKKIYEDAKEPLFGRADFKIDLQPFKVPVLKEILEDNKSYSAKNILDLYTLTGGVAKYIELFVLREAFDLDTMIDEMISPHSLFLDEGKNRLIEEFGKEYGTYFSILSLIASSKTSRSAIESILEKNISGHLYRLEHDYGIIKSIKPIGSKPNAKVQKYRINDNFLAFWFRFIYKYQSYIEAENFESLKKIIKRDFSTFQGYFLEKLFTELLKQESFGHIGSYWERGNENEIDIVAVDDLEKRVVICEVKLSKKRLDRDVLVAKSQKLLQKFPNYSVEYRLLSVEDIEGYLG